MRIDQYETLGIAKLFLRRCAQLLMPMVLVSCFRSNQESHEKASSAPQVQTPPGPFVESVKTPATMPSSTSAPEVSKKFKKWMPPQRTSQRIVQTEPEVEQPPTASAVPVPTPVPPPQLAPEPSPLVEVPLCQESSNLMSFWLGFGVSNFNFEQKSSLETESGRFAVQTFGALSMGAGVKFSESAHLEFEYHQVQGQIPIQGSTTLDTRELTQKSWGLEYHHQIYATEQSSSQITVGVQDHHVPLLSTDQVRSLVNVFDMEFVNAVVGVRYSQWVAPAYEVEVKLNYHIPLHSQAATSYSVKTASQSLVEGTAGLRRRFKNGMTAGLFVVGKSLGYDYELTRDGATAVGSQHLRDVTVEVRVGWEF